MIACVEPFYWRRCLSRPPLLISQIIFQGRQRRIGHEMFHALRISFGCLRRHTEHKQSLVQETAPRPHALGKSISGVGQEHATISLRHG